MVYLVAVKAFSPEVVVVEKLGLSSSRKRGFEFPKGPNLLIEILNAIYHMHDQWEIVQSDPDSVKVIKRRA